MKRLSFLILFASLMLFSFGLAHAVTEITLDNMTGLLSETGDSVIAGASVRWNLRLTYTLGDGSSISGSTNGFEVYTHLGGTYTDNFTAVTYDTFSWDWPSIFDLTGGLILSDFSVDGVGADTVGFGGAKIFGPGIVDGTDSLCWWIETTPSTDGDTLCIDSAFYPPGGQWLWATNGPLGAFTPDWGGPYCFHVYDPTAVPESLEVTPGTLYFTAVEGGANPDPDTFTVSETGGGAIAFTLAETSGWFALDTTAGTTPQDVEVSVDISSLTAGSYFDSVIVASGEANNSPQLAYISLEVTSAANYLAVAPDTLYLTAFAGGSNPDSKYFIVSEVGGGAIVFTLAETSTWFALNKTGGTTPESVFVALISAPSTTGDYFDSVTVSSGEAANSPQYAFVMLTVYPYQDTIIIPTNEWINVYCDYPELNGVPLMSGDVIVAYDPDGVPCGIDTVRADGSFGFMPIYRDDPRSAVDEGAEPGDVIAFTINGKEVFPEPPVIWTVNGDSFELCTFTTERCVEIFLHTGWNLISWNVAYSAGIDEIMAQLAKSTCVEVILSFDQGALTYDPDLPEFSTLLEVDYYRAYWFKMNCNVTLEICGFPIEPDEGIVIYSGWNLVSDLPNDTLSVEEGFESILDNLLLALGYDYDGLTWLPGDSLFNTLTELWPLFGYWAKSSADDMLAYPGFNPVVAAPKDESGSQVAAAGVMPSRSWMSLYGSGITLDDAELASHTLIEAYTHDGVLCGSGHYTDGLLKFTPVYGYDPMSEVTADYPKDGDPVTLYVNGMRVYPDVEWAGHSSRVLIGQVFSTAAGAGLVPDRYALLQNYPNPFNPTTEIAFTLPVASRVNLEIYNVLGQRVTTLAEGVLEAGEHIAVWDGTDANGHTVSTGIYLYRLQAGDFVDTKKMVLMK